MFQFQLIEKMNFSTNYSDSISLPPNFQDMCIHV